jgi:hypothetical protein
MDRNVRLVGNIRREFYSIKRQNGRMKFEKNAVPNPALLPRQKFHGVIRAEAKMNVLVHALISVCVLAPLVPACGRDSDTHTFEVGEGVQTAVLPDERKIPPVGKMIEERDLLKRVREVAGFVETAFRFR